jgi:hypothetical protein
MAGPDPQQDTWRARVKREIAAHPMAYIVTAAFLLGGPIAASLLFPQAPPAITVVGGVVFGAAAALYAVPGKFLDDD